MDTPASSTSSHQTPKRVEANLGDGSELSDGSKVRSSSGAGEGASTIGGEDTATAHTDTTHGQREQPPWRKGMHMRICIIGAGAAGLATLKILKDTREYKEGLWTVDVFEEREDIGGTWLPAPAHGNPPLTPMYDSVTANLPHPLMCFPSMCFPPSTPLYPSVTQVLEYLRAYSDRFELRKDVRLEERVIRTKWTGREWEVRTRTKRQTQIQTHTRSRMQSRSEREQTAQDREGIGYGLDASSGDSERLIETDLEGLLAELQCRSKTIALMHGVRYEHEEVEFEVEHDYVYDRLVIANGHFRHPSYPSDPEEAPGLAAWLRAGRATHIAWYRGAPTTLTSSKFAGKKVLVVGGGFSGCDIADEMSRVCGTLVHSRTGSGIRHTPKRASQGNVRMRGRVVRFSSDPEEGKVWFSAERAKEEVTRGDNETMEEVEEAVAHVLLATGYRYILPFFEDLVNDDVLPPIPTPELAVPSRTPPHFSDAATVDPLANGYSGHAKTTSSDSRSHSPTSSSPSPSPSHSASSESFALPSSLHCDGYRIFPLAQHLFPLLSKPTSTFSQQDNTRARSWLPPYCCAFIGLLFNVAVLPIFEAQARACARVFACPDVLNFEDELWALQGRYESLSQKLICLGDDNAVAGELAKRRAKMWHGFSAIEQFEYRDALHRLAGYPELWSSAISSPSPSENEGEVAATYPVPRWNRDIFARLGTLSPAWRAICNSGQEEVEKWCNGVGDTGDSAGRAEWVDLMQRMLKWADENQP